MKNSTALTLAGMFAVGGVLLLVAPDEEPYTPPTTTYTAPTPTPYSADDYTDTPDATVLASLRVAWNQSTPAEQARMCAMYRVEPDAAWEAFSGGDTTVISHSQFRTFFTAECGQPL